MSKISRRTVLRGTALGLIAPISGIFAAQNPPAPAPDAMATDYPAGKKSCAIYSRVPDQNPSIDNTGTFDFGISNLNEGLDGYYCLPLGYRSSSRQRRKSSGTAPIRL